jgi:hypothetical protein
MGHLKVKEWWFKEGQTSVESDEHSGRLSMSRNQLMVDTSILLCWITDE